MTSRAKDPSKFEIKPTVQYWFVARRYEIGTNQKRDQLINKKTVIEQTYTNEVILSGEQGYADADIEKCYSLSNPEIYGELLIDYLKICDADSALEYIRKRGFPAGARSGSTTSHEVAWSVNDLIDSANYLRFLWHLASEMQSEDISKLHRYIKVSASNNRSPKRKNLSEQKTMAVALHDPDDEGKYICCFESSKGGPQRLMSLLNESPLEYDASVWKSYGTKKNIFAVQRYLQRALERLLVGAQPRLDWALTTDGNWVLYETTKANTPWQAICYALLQHVTQKNIIKSCRECGKPIAGRKTFCGDTCNTRFNRKNGSTVNSYPKKRKG